MTFSAFLLPPPQHWHRLPQTSKISWIILINRGGNNRGKPNHCYTPCLESELFQWSLQLCSPTPRAQPTAPRRPSPLTPCQPCLLLPACCRTAAEKLLKATLRASQLSRAMVRKQSQGHGMRCCDSKMDAALHSPPTYSQTGLPGCSLWRSSGANRGIPKWTGRWPALTKSTAETNSSPSASQSMQEPVTGRFGLLGSFLFSCVEILTAVLTSSTPVLT